jgi:hypothetical protein
VHPAESGLYRRLCRHGCPGFTPYRRRRDDSEVDAGRVRAGVPSLRTGVRAAREPTRALQSLRGCLPTLRAALQGSQWDYWVHSAIASRHEYKSPLRPDTRTVSRQVSARFIPRGTSSASDPPVSTDFFRGARAFLANSYSHLPAGRTRCRSWYSKTPIWRATCDASSRKSGPSLADQRQRWAWSRMRLR